MFTNRFFGCCSLKTGAITWGIFTLIIDTVILSGVVTVLTMKSSTYYDYYWGFCCVPFLVDQIAAIGLIFGAVKENVNWILFWLVVNGVLIVGFLIVLIVMAIYVGYTCVLLMCLGIMTYVWACIFTYYKSFDDPTTLFSSIVFTKV